MRDPFFWLAAFLVLNFAVPFFNISTRGAAIFGAIALTIAYVSIVVFFTVALARRKLSIPKLLFFGVLAALLWIALDRWLGRAIISPIVASLRETQTRPDTLQTLQLLSV